MARLRRNFVPGAVHHAISRFHGGAYRLRTQSERTEYLRRFSKALCESDWELLAYALMSNHVHLVLLAGLLPPGDVFRSAHSGFAPWLNERQGGLGYVFADRFRLWAMRRPPAELIAYVHNNPVRAGLVRAARDSPWTSHSAYLAPEMAPSWLAVATALERAGFPSAAEFDNYVEARKEDPRDPTWTGTRDAGARRDARVVAGNAIELAEPIISDVDTYGALLRPRGFAELRGSYTPEQVLEVVAAVVGVHVGSIRGRGKAREASRGRRLALRAWRSMRGSQAEMCAALGMSSSAASGLLRSQAAHHLAEDDERVWAELLRTYPQEI